MHTIMKIINHPDILREYLEDKGIDLDVVKSQLRDDMEEHDSIIPCEVDDIIQGNHISHKEDKDKIKDSGFSADVNCPYKVCMRVYINNFQY